MTFFKRRGAVMLFSLLAIAAVFISCGGSRAYHVGDIIMSDGNVFSKDGYASYKGNAKPVAVIFSVTGADSERSDRVLGISLEDAGTDLMLASVELKTVLSENSAFQAALVRNQVYYDELDAFDNEGFTGNLDGRKITYNFSAEDLKFIESNKHLLPAYNAAVSYGEGKDLGIYKSGWYFPSAAELFKLYQNMDSVNESIAAAGGSLISKTKYWTSSCAYKDGSKNYSIDFSTGKLSEDSRQESYSSRAVYCFHEKEKKRGGKNYILGDIVMDDGTVLSPIQLDGYKGSAKPMAVIFSVRGGHFEESDRVLGVGLKASEPLQFAQEGTAGHDENIMANQSMLVSQEYSIKKGFYDNGGFLGLMDGRKTWSNVALYDKNAKNSSADYPAFDYAVNYGKNNGFEKFTDGWYLPTASEAFELAEYIHIVNFSIEKCGGKALDETVWTSSQNYSMKDGQYLVGMDDGKVESGFKDASYNAYAVYCFE